MARKTKPKREEAPREEEGPSPDERMAELEAKCSDFEARWLRAQADYKNLRRRSLEDLEAGLQRSMQPLLEELLFVLDFLDMALAAPATNDETKNLVLGVQMTRQRFWTALENSEVREIPTDGPFDPGTHDATDTREEEGAEPGTILETVRRGYTWQGRVLRPAQVVVAAVSENAEREESEGGSED